MTAVLIDVDRAYQNLGGYRRADVDRATKKAPAEVAGGLT